MRECTDSSPPTRLQPALCTWSTLLRSMDSTCARPVGNTLAYPLGPIPSVSTLQLTKLCHILLPGFSQSSHGESGLVAISHLKNEDLSLERRLLCLPVATPGSEPRPPGSWSPILPLTLCPPPEPGSCSLEALCERC